MSEERVGKDTHSSLLSTHYSFTVKVGKPKDPARAKRGTKLSRGANFECLMSGTPIAGDYIKAEGKAGRMGARLMAIVAEGDRERVYLAPTADQEAVARRAKPEWRPEGDIAARMTGGNCTPYGLTSWGNLFTSRQLVALTTFSDLVQEARELAYRLFVLSERKKRAREALSYNGLVQSWPDILRLAREAGDETAEPAQAGLL